MKKNRRFRSLKDRIMRKKMFAYTLLFGLLFALPVNAQEKQHRVSLTANQLTVVDIFKLLEEQVPYKFLFHDAGYSEAGEEDINVKEGPFDRGSGFLFERKCYRVRVCRDVNRVQAVGENDEY